MNAKTVSAPLATVRTTEALREATRQWRAQGLSIGLVPTMGALHEGHLALVRAAKHDHARVVASIFVNAKQFAPSEDFSRYPRNEAADAALLAEAGCDLLYAPEQDHIYPPGFATSVAVAGVSAPLEGQMRPHFFGGVATIVAKLLIQCAPDGAYFGEKDYQQVLVVQRMARDLDLGGAIVARPTVREADGLAMSSRNAYLSAPERAIAGKLNVILAQGAARARAGAPIEDVEHDCATRLLGAGFARIDYVAVRDAETLEAASLPQRPARILAAAWLGETRLIDNMAV